MKKDLFLSFIIIIGVLSITYLIIFCGLLSVLLFKEISGTATQSGTGTFFDFAITNYWLLIVSAIFSLIFIAYKIKHEKNQKRKNEQKKYSGSLIGKPL